MHDVFPALEHFSWQLAYGDFTVSQSNADEVRRFTAKQKEHHRVSFRDEFIEFLKANGIEYDERYVQGAGCHPLCGFFLFLRPRSWGSRPRNYEAGSPKVDLKVGQYPTVYEFGLNESRLTQNLT